MRKILAILSMFAMLLVLSSCAEEVGVDKQRKSMQAQSDQALEKQTGAVPYPADQITDSLERRNLKERLLRQNDPSRVGYVYFVPFGKFMGYWTIKGKVSSTQSQMNPADDISEDMCPYRDCSEHVVSQSAGDDGAFGEAERGVFFFTTDGVMVQLPEDDYVYSDQPIAIGNIPELNK